MPCGRFCTSYDEIDLGEWNDYTSGALPPIPNVAIPTLPIPELQDPNKPAKKKAPTKTPANQNGDSTNDDNQNPSNVPPDANNAKGDQQCLTKTLWNTGDLMQQYGVGFVAGGAVVTFVAPQAGVGEAAVPYGFAMYGTGSAIKDSISLANTMYGGSGASFALGQINNLALQNVPSPMRDSVGVMLDKAEEATGLGNGEEDTLCH